MRERKLLACVCVASDYRRKDHTHTLIIIIIIINTYNDNSVIYELSGANCLMMIKPDDK